MLFMAATRLSRTASHSKLSTGVLKASEYLTAPVQTLSGRDDDDGAATRHDTFPTRGEREKRREKKKKRRKKKGRRKTRRDEEANERESTLDGRVHGRTLALAPRLRFLRWEAKNRRPVLPPPAALPMRATACPGHLTKRGRILDFAFLHSSKVYIIGIAVAPRRFLGLVSSTFQTRRQTGI